jgi:very-short-patch-repair endonuclease
MALTKSLPDRKKVYKSDSPVMAAIAEILCDAGYQRQVNLKWDKAGSLYRLDFAHSKKKITVEIITPGRRSTLTRDARRDANLRALKWKVVRIPIEEVTVERLRKECCWWYLFA